MRESYTPEVMIVLSAYRSHDPVPRKALVPRIDPVLRKALFPRIAPVPRVQLLHLQVVLALVRGVQRSAEGARKAPHERLHGLGSGGSQEALRPTQTGPQC